MGNSTYYLLPRSLSPIFNLYSCQKKSEKKVDALFQKWTFSECPILRYTKHFFISENTKIQFKA
jgi:hypothetical protein